ncbi:hypothetical protein U6B65_06890 [Oscillospiraceae bacterium MB08-C2-2]|nr:hypothetical protein U6B65_06890 [Oscillospiraceae bacterium MB08-C2-2]
MSKFKSVLPSPAAAAVLVAAVILALALFAWPMGMADNGDFFRMIHGNGLYKLDQHQDDAYFNYFSQTFGRYEYFNESGESLLSSQTPFIKGAMALDNLLTGGDNVFDIRFLALPMALWALLAIYMLVDWASWGQKKRDGYIIAALAVYFFADTGYAVYFNSFYAEGLVLVSFLTAMASALLLEQKRYNPYLMLGVFLVSGVVLTSAKQQNAPLGFLLGILSLLMALGHSGYKLSQEKGGSWLRKNLFSKVAAFGAVLLCFTGWAVYALIPQEFVYINQYHAMTRGVMMTSENPETVLEEFDMDPQYSLVDQTIYFERYPAADVESKELKERFYSHYGFVSISAYYITHPGQLLQMLDYSAQSANAIRPAVIGNYQRNAGKAAAAQTQFFTLHSSLKEAFTPHTVGFMILWVAVAIGVSFTKRWRTTVLACAILMGFSQIGTSIVGAGDADLSKHIFLYNVASDFTLYVLLASVLIPWIARRTAKSKAKPQVVVAEKEAVLVGGGNI